MLQQISLGGMMIALPIYLQMVLEYDALGAGLSGAALADHVRDRDAGREASRTAASQCHHPDRVPPARPRRRRADPDRAQGRVRLVPPAGADGGRAGLGLLVSQLNNYTLAPISEERVSEAAGVNSAAGSFGLSFGLAFAGAIMLATLSVSFTQLADSSTVLPPDAKQQVAQALEEDAQVMSNTQLEELLAAQPEDISEEIIRINTEARPLSFRWRCWSRCSPA